jgi:hypothetical protein
MFSLTIKNEKDLSQALMQVANLNSLINKKAFTLEIKEYREKRSKNANDYSWVLQDKIAKAIGRSIDEVHKWMVLQYGVIETFSILKSAFESAKRMFDYYEILGESTVNGKEFIHVKAGIGTHLYNSLEMSKFLEGVVLEAQNLDIETKTPDEIAQMKSLWEQGER